VHSGTILIVDDELPIRSALARYLSRLGYRVLEAADVAQALSQAEQHGWRLDLVLTDAQLPYASGLELSEQLRQRCPGIPRLFMTDRAHGPARRPANEIPPVADRIDKPFDLHLVAERVRAELRNRR
jgi:DNA-binding response OmpR family regulator